MAYFPMGLKSTTPKARPRTEMANHTKTRQTTFSSCRKERTNQTEYKEKVGVT
jgi:hypothetical protein